MEDKVRQPQLLDAYIDDLLQNSRISPPLDLNLELAEITREVVLTEQHIAATNTTRAAQGRVWRQVLDEAAFLPKNVSTAVFGWRYLRGAGLQVAVGLVLAFVVILMLSGPTSHRSPATQIPVSVVAAELITPAPLATAPATPPAVLSVTHTLAGDSAMLAPKTALPLRNVRSNLLNDGAQYTIDAALASDIDEVEARQGFNSRRVYYR